MQAKPYHHGNLRSALIEAGLAALARDDVSQLSLRALAREVGVSANAAYRHFEDKDALLSALAAEGFRRFAAMQAQAFQCEGDTRAAALASGQAYVSFACEHPALFRLMFGPFVHRQASDELQASAKLAFQGLIQSTALAAGLPEDDERAMFKAVARWSLVHGLSHLILDGHIQALQLHADNWVEEVLSAMSATPSCN